MRPEIYSADAILRLLQRQTIATMDEVKGTLGTRADITVFRKLRSIDYLSSYSHGGRYYALKELARFDDRGLWTYRGVHFSRFGSLLETAQTFVNRADRGLFANELTAELHVETKEPLLKLVRQQRLGREEVSGRYLYCSSERKNVGTKSSLENFLSSEAKPFLRCTNILRIPMTPRLQSSSL